MTIQFPFPIEQVDKNAVKVPCSEGPILDGEFARQISRWGLSEIQIDELVIALIREAIAKSIKVR